MTRHTHDEPMEHLWPSDEYVRAPSLEDALRREYRAGFWGGHITGIVAGLFLAPLVWIGVMMLGG